MSRPPSERAATGPIGIRDPTGGTRRLSLRQIEVFRTVMLSGSINAAAAVLHTSQPSLSRVIRRAEDVLGFRLFERAGGRLSPTREAATLFAHVGRVYERLDELREAVDGMARGSGTLFRFGTTGSPNRHLVPLAVAALRAQSPDLAVQIDVLVVEQIIDYLIFGRGECVVSVFPVQHPLIQSKALGEGDVACLMPSDHPLAGRDAVTTAELFREHLILFEAGTPHGAMAEDLFAAGSAYPDVGVRVRHIETAVGLVRHGVGIAVVDSFAVGDDARPGSGLSVARIEGAAKLNLYLSWNRETARSRFLPALQKGLVAAVKRRPSREFPASPMPSRHRTAKNGH